MFFHFILNRKQKYAIGNKFLFPYWWRNVALLKITRGHIFHIKTGNLRPIFHFISNLAGMSAIPISATPFESQSQTYTTATTTFSDLSYYFPLSRTILTTSQLKCQLLLRITLVPVMISLVNPRRSLEKGIPAEQREMMVPMPNLSAVMVLTILSPSLRSLEHCLSVLPIDPYLHLHLWTQRPEW